MTLRVGIGIAAWVLLSATSQADVTWDFSSPPPGFVVTPPQTWNPGAPGGSLALPGAAIQGFNPRPPERSTVETPPFRFTNVAGARLDFDLKVPRGPGPSDSFRELLSNDIEDFEVNLLDDADGSLVAHLFSFQATFPLGTGLPANDEEPVEITLDFPDESINTTDEVRLQFRYFHFVLREFVLGSLQIDNLTVQGANSALPGDLDGDGVVWRGDLALVARNWGRQSGAVYADGDLNGNGVVSLADLRLLQSYLTPPGSPVIVVAEPSSTSLAMAVLFVAACYGFAIGGRLSFRATRKPNVS